MDWSAMSASSQDTEHGSIANKRKKADDSASPERRELLSCEDYLAITFNIKIKDTFREPLEGKGPDTFEEYKKWVKAIMQQGIGDACVLTEHIRRQEDLKNRLINSLTRENRLMAKELAETRAQLARAQGDGSKTNQPSYAAAVTAGHAMTASNMIAKPTYKQPRSTTVRMADKSATETAAAVKSKIKHMQKDVKATVAVVGQNVRVSCEHQASLDMIKQVLKDDKTVTTDRTMLKPQVKVVGIDQFDATTFVDMINEYNDGILGENSRVATTMKYRDKVDVVIETTGPVQQRILGKGSLLHGFSNHRVYEHLQLRQCVKCLGLGHKKDQCKSCDKCLSSNCKGSCTKPVKQICFKCAGDHMRKDCNAAAPKCAVCLHHGRVINGKHTKDHANHVMLGRECPLRVQGEQALKQRTDYG